MACFMFTSPGSVSLSAEFSWVHHEQTVLSDGSIRVGVDRANPFTMLEPLPGDSVCMIGPFNFIVEGDASASAGGGGGRKSASINPLARASAVVDAGRAVIDASELPLAPVPTPLPSVIQWWNGNGWSSLMPKPSKTGAKGK
jgi:hypothetical protein